MRNLPKQLSIVSYAVNGRGVGHLTRLIAIQRWVRRYGVFCGVNTQHWFLTTSEADTMLHHEGFAGFKLPSKSVVESAGIDKLAYIALAKQWVWNSVALLRPDLFLVDTFPNGSFQELLSVLDLCAKKALIVRAVKRQITDQASYRAVAGLYDKVIASTREEERDSLRSQLGLPDKRLSFVGPIMRKERFELYTRDEARERLGIPKDARCWLVSGGGGGDDTVDKLFAQVEALFADDTESYLIFAAGPLFRGARRAGPRRIFWTSSDLSEYLPAVDAAISAGGFNAAHELMFAGVPSIFVPQEKIADDQLRRVQDLAERGGALVVSATFPLRAAIHKLCDDELCKQMSARAKAAVPENHARDAAREVLELCLPHGLLEQAQAELQDALLMETRALGTELGHIVDVALALGGPQVVQDRELLELDRALELVELSVERTGRAELACQLARLLSRKVKPRPEDHADEIGEAVTQLLEARVLDGQWSGLQMLLSSWPAERRASAPQLVRELVELSQLASTRKFDLVELTRLAMEETPGHSAQGALGARLRQRLCEGQSVETACNEVDA